MLTTIKGVYEQGKIILKEAPPVNAKGDVIVTFLESVEKEKVKRKLGGLEGKVTIPDDFNDPLEDLKDYM